MTLWFILRILKILIQPMAAARMISNEDWVHSIRFGCGDGYFWGIFHVNNFLNHGFKEFSGLHGL